MAVLNLTIDRAGDGFSVWRPGSRETLQSDALHALRQAVLATPRSAPVVILLHDYRYDPNNLSGHFKRDPHLTVLRPDAQVRGATPSARFCRPPSWPALLKFDGPPERGLAIAVGWSSLPTKHAGRPVNPLCWAYSAASQAAKVVADIARIAADVRNHRGSHGAQHGGCIDFFGHSLGARVAFLALRIATEEGWSSQIGRILALGAAEYRDQALRAAMCCREDGPVVVNFLSRANDPYDALLQIFGPRSAFAANARPVGAAGLGRKAPGWIDLQIDHPAMAEWLRCKGVDRGRLSRRCCHDAFYAQPGMTEFQRRLVDERWNGQDLRRLGAVEAIEPRWARFYPLRMRDLPPPRGLARGAGKASHDLRKGGREAGGAAAL